jgi:hypothetical protein
MPELYDALKGRYVVVSDEFIAKCRAFDAALMARLAEQGPNRIRDAVAMINARRRMRSQWLRDQPQGQGAAPRPAVKKRARSTARRRR